MAVQQLAKDQAKREKKNQKDLDKKFKEDEENALKDTQRMIDLMERIYKQPVPPASISPDSRFKRPETEAVRKSLEVFEIKSGGQIKCGAQIKGTSPLIRKRK